MTLEIPQFVPGFVYDKPRMLQVMSDRMARGDKVFASSYADANPREQLPGAWSRMKAAGVTFFSLHEFSKKLRGQYLRPYFQKSGTCVSRGITRAGQLSLDYAIQKRSLMLKPVELSFAPIYVAARHEIGKDRCGYGDGAILSDAAQAVHDLGMATSELFAGTNEDQQEQLAVKYAAPGVGLPGSWRTAMAGHTAVTFAPDTLDLIYDCICSGYGVAYASGTITGSPNTKGISSVGSPGGHCRMFSGVFVDDNGDTQLESTESWSCFPAAPPNQKYSTCPIDEIPRITLHYANGQLRQLAPGCVGVNAKAFWNQIQSSGEAWAIGVMKYEADTVAGTDAKSLVA